MSVLDEIQAQFPHPISIKDLDTDDPAWESAYCVGGAVCRFMTPGAEGFPLSRQITRALHALNPALPLPQPYIADDPYSEGEGVTLARQIMTLNDEGEIDRAWHKVAEALDWRPQDFRM